MSPRKTPFMQQSDLSDSHHHGTIHVFGIAIISLQHIGRRRQMRHEGRIRGSDEQTMTLVVATTDVGRIIGKCIILVLRIPPICSLMHISPPPIFSQSSCTGTCTCIFYTCKHPPMKFTYLNIYL